jgi:glycosyltransferase involved in cell wall biosynthesis
VVGGINLAKKKIFHIITKLELGGAQKNTLMTLALLPRGVYDLGLISGCDGPMDRDAERIPDVRLYWVPSMVREVRAWKDLKTLWKLYSVMRRERPDIIHTHSSKAGILGRWAGWAAGVPVIIHTAHGFGFNDRQRALVRSFYVWLERVTYYVTTRFVVVSLSNARTGEAYRIFKAGQWVLCRSAIALDEFMVPAPKRASLAEWGIGRDKVVVGMVACFKPQKSPVDFVEIAAGVLQERDDVHFVMIGDGELRGEIEDKIAESGIGDNITLLGWRRDMPEVYRNLDVLVLTSLWEGLPRVFAEAMANELPIVATNVDGASEAIIDGKTGYLHRPHDIEGMTRSVLRLVSAPEERRSMGEEGRSRVVEFEIGNSQSRLEATYRECLGAL